MGGGGDATLFKRELWIRAHSGLAKMPVVLPLLGLGAPSEENSVLAAAFCAREKRRRAEEEGVSQTRQAGSVSVYWHTLEAPHGRIYHRPVLLSA